MVPIRPVPKYPVTPGVYFKCFLFLFLFLGGGIWAKSAAGAMKVIEIL